MNLPYLHEFFPPQPSYVSFFLLPFRTGITDTKSCPPIVNALKCAKRLKDPFVLLKTLTEFYTVCFALPRNLLIYQDLNLLPSP